MPISRQGPNTRTLSKVISGGGLNFQPSSGMTLSSYGPGWPIAPVSAPTDVELPRSIDYPISVNSTLVPRTAYGLMPFSALLEAYENVTECRMPVALIHRELTSFTPRLLDPDGNEIIDHPYAWMCKYPDRKTPFNVWMTRFLKSSKVYDAPAIFLQQSGGKVEGMHYIDGSTLFLIVDALGNIPQDEAIRDYTQRLSDEDRSKFIESYSKYSSNSKGAATPTRIPAYTQVIKGTPFSWWSADQVWYMPQSRRLNAPYGESFIEQAWSWIMIIVNLVAFELGHYRTGNMPEGFVTLPKDVYNTPDKVLLAELMYNQRMTSNPATERNRLRMFPEGTGYVATKSADFPQALYKQAWFNVLHSIGIPPSEFGEIPGAGLGGAGFKEGAASDLGRNTLNPQREFVATPFNYVLERDGVTDVVFDLSYPTDEVDPDKLKTGVYDGMAHGTLSLNDGLAELGMPPVGDVNDPNNVANKHLIVAGAVIYVIEDMQSVGGIATPNFSGAPGGNAGGLPVGPETAMLQDGAEHTPQDFETIRNALQHLMAGENIDGKTISVPSGKQFKNGVAMVPAPAPIVSTDYHNYPRQTARPSYTIGVDWAHGILNKVDATHTDSAMVAVFMPLEIAVGLRSITEMIGFPPEAELETPANMHVTLAFLPDAGGSVDMNYLTAGLETVARSYKPLSGRIQGYGVFNGQDGRKVLFALLDEPSLPFLRTAVCERLDEYAIKYGTDYGFVPHVTLAYFPADFQLPAGFHIPDMSVDIPCLSVAFGERREDMPFVSAAGPAYAMEKHCGVCTEDDQYFGATVSRELGLAFPENNHANGVEIVAMTPDDLPAKPALWKPEGGEDEYLREVVGGGMYLREEAAYLLDRSLNFYMVPVAYATMANGEAGAAIYYTGGMGEARDPADYAPQWVERAAVLDCISGELDRGYRHNYGTHPDDPERLILFDNGMSFPVGTDRPGKSPFVDLMANKLLSQDTVNALILCNGDNATWKDISVLVGPEATEAARSRLRGLIANKMIVLYQDNFDPSFGSSGL